MATTRCFYFDSDGRPRGGGCQRDRCHFVHPTDRDWKDAPESSFIPAHLRTARPARDPIRRPRSPLPHRSPSPYRSRRSSAASRDSPDRARAPSTAHRPRNDSVSSVRVQKDSSVPPPAPTLSPSTPSMLSRPPPPLPLPSELAHRPPLLPSFPTPIPAAVPPPEILRERWAKMVELLAASTKYRHEFEKIKEDIKDNESLKNLNRYSASSEDNQQQLAKFLLKRQNDMEDTKKKLDDTVSELTKSSTWLVGPSSSDAEEPDSRQELIKNIEDLAEKATKLNAVLNELQDADNSAMDTDPPEPQRAKKRRRLSNGEQSVDFDFDRIRERVTELEGLFSNFENGIVARDEDMKFEVEERVESTFQRLISHSSPAPASENQLHSIQEEIKDTGNQVQELADEIGNLILRSDAQKSELAEVMQQLEEASRSRAELERQLQGYIDNRAKDRSEMDALEKAIELYTSKAPTSPVTQEHLLYYIQEPVLDMVRESVQPLIEALRNQVQQMLQNQSQEMYQTLWNKLSLTFQMVETISQRIEQGAESG